MILINARKLNEILYDSKNFSRWLESKIIKKDLKKDIDYFEENVKLKTLKGVDKERKEYYLTQETCKQIIFSRTTNKKVKKIKKKIEEGVALTEIINEIINEKETKVKIVRFEDEEYPEQLRKIKNPPKQLYVKGNIENLKEYGIAVIGSRDCSNYGRTICRIFTKNLVGYNLNIISGLAIGIDGCAHRACIEAKGKTIAVLPSGLDNIFPKENEELLNRILKNGGTVLTEYPPEFKKTQESCRERNRIMSGLAIATLVIEAEKRSGTSITVGYTNEQNKKAFCIPSSLLNSKGVGTNEMIKENKAQLVTKVEDIIKEYPELKLEKKSNFNFKELKINRTAKKEDIQAEVKLDEENLEIYSFLTKEAKEINEIAEKLNKPVNEILYKLTLLEIEGVIEELPGKKFRIKKGK